MALQPPVDDDDDDDEDDDDDDIIRHPELVRTAAGQDTMEITENLNCIVCAKKSTALISLVSTRFKIIDTNIKIAKKRVC